VTAPTATGEGAQRAAGDGVPTPGKAPPAPAPEPLPADALDGHCHIDQLEPPAGEVIAAAQAVGIRRMVTVGIDLPSSRWSAECAADYRDVYAAVAIHPNETASADSSPGGRDAVLAEIAALAALPRVRVVGETGLDYYRDDASPDVQRDWFRAHIALAKQAGKTLMIHDRDAHDDVLRILEEEGPPERVIFHCFSGDAAMARRCAEAGYVMSFAGNVTFKNAQSLRAAAVAAPAEAMLVETDAPYLAPMPYRGKANSPALASVTMRCLAEVKQIDLARLCELVTATGERVFGPW
jgi:TatD DNase family protein